jgi:hypothetical protein
MNTGSAHNIVRHPDMPKEAFADLWKNILSGKSWSGIIKNRQKNGGFYWVKSDVIVLYNDGVHTGFMSVRSKPKPGEIANAENLYQADLLLIKCTLAPIFFECYPY